MYESAKGEIQSRQGGFLAYEVSGKTPLIHKGGEGASARESRRFKRRAEASNDPSGSSTSFCPSLDQTRSLKLRRSTQRETDFQTSADQTFVSYQDLMSLLLMLWSSSVKANKGVLPPICPLGRVIGPSSGGSDRRKLQLEPQEASTCNRKWGPTGRP